MADCVRDEIIEQLQLHGRQPAKKIAETLGRNEKVVMRVMAQLVDDGTVVFDVVPEVRMLRSSSTRAMVGMEPLVLSIRGRAVIGRVVR